MVLATRLRKLEECAAIRHDDRRASWNEFLSTLTIDELTALESYLIARTEHVDATPLPLEEVDILRRYHEAAALG
jgi:hypothetical protein